MIRASVAAVILTALIVAAGWALQGMLVAEYVGGPPAPRPAPVVLVPPAPDPLGDALHSLPMADVVRLCSWGTTLSPAEEALAQAC